MDGAASRARMAAVSIVSTLIPTSRLGSSAFCAVDMGYSRTSAICVVEAAGASMRCSCSFGQSSGDLTSDGSSCTNKSLSFSSGGEELSKGPIQPAASATCKTRSTDMPTIQSCTTSPKIGTSHLKLCIPYTGLHTPKRPRGEPWEAMPRAVDHIAGKRRRRVEDCWIRGAE